VKFGQPRDDGFVVAVSAVAAQLRQIGEQQPMKSSVYGALRMPRDLRALHGPKWS